MATGRMALTRRLGSTLSADSTTFGWNRDAAFHEESSNPAVHQPVSPCRVVELASEVHEVPHPSKVFGLGWSSTVRPSRSAGSHL